MTRSLRASNSETFHSHGGGDKNALEDISFTIGANEKRSIIGENGAGKSTLVKLLLGIYTPTGGTIYINGEVMDTDRYDYTPLFSAVFQDYKIFSFTVGENIKMSGDALTGAEKERIHSLLGSMGMRGLVMTICISRRFFPTTA